MNGCVIKGTPIAVDFWKPTKAPQARLFFLTHLHADHTQGLTGRWRLPIYTSPTNAVLLENKFKLPRSIIKELEVGETYLIPLDNDGNHTISVTVIDANHVPGAVMFLFQGYFGNILYCGDMRWYPELLEQEVLRNVVELRELDVIYLDNTFSAPYCDFPSREECKRQLFQIIDLYPDHIIKLGMRDLGREDLLEAVAQRFQERILVTQRKYELLQLLQYSDVFTTNPKEARIHAVPIQQLQVATHNRWNQEHPTISVILTALYIGWPNGPFSSQSNNGIFTVPYSDHSSYPELMEFVANLAPRCVMPIVQRWSKSGWWSDPGAPNQTIKGDMSVYNHLLTPPPPDPFEVPEPVANLMRAGAPMLVTHQPRRCGLRRGLAPRSRRMRGVVYTSPESRISFPVPSTPSPAPTSSITLDLSLVDSSRSLSLLNPTKISTPKKISVASVRKPIGKKQLYTQKVTLTNEQYNCVTHTVTDSSIVTHSSGIPIMRTDSKKQIPSSKPVDSTITSLLPSKGNVVHSLGSIAQGSQLNALNSGGDSLCNLSLRDKRSHLITHTTTLISNECALLKNDNDKAKNKDEISRLLKNTKTICEALALVKSVLN